MENKKFISIITAAGLEKFAAAALSGEPAGISVMAVGDGGGILPAPSPEQTALIRETYRAPLNRLDISDGAANVIEAEMIIPPQAGGFTMREVALFDDEGVCLAVASMPETYKPVLSQGARRFSVIRMQLAVASTADIQLINDPGVTLATVENVINAGNAAKDYADDALSDHELSRNHPDATAEMKGFTRLSNATDSDKQDRAATPLAVKAAITQAIRAAWELDNPVGTTRFFSRNVNPNENWPWSQWVYTGENKTIRVGKADGSNVGATGGSDTVTLQRANLPAVQINVTGETSEQPEQTLTTTRGGVHNHGGVAGKDDPWEIGGDVRQLFNPKELGVTDDAGEHDHEVTVPPHQHTTSGKTDNLGDSQSFSVVEAHTLLMCWARVA
ncbi:Tail fiber protein [Klebsiella pneumoniae]|uniref:phage tail protein n=1 Tax=Klebsiella pneumoniae TaxID=573 RepID=UPI000E06CF28|nr:phage tail protein [Klebsiella pneumoniae]MCP5599656.1 phage tail protein [Klebsiella pneumoniae]STV89707.1 Tail fiber protein [Klebsiella pneumoniae]